MTIAYVYKWTELSTLNWYVGSRTAKNCHPDDGYICSSRVVKPMIKANPDNWKREIIATGEPKEMMELESEILRMFDAANDPRSYNQHNNDGKFHTQYLDGVTGIHHPKYGVILDDDARDRLSEGKIGERNPMFGKTGPHHHNYGMKHSQEAKNKMSALKKGSANPNYGKMRDTSTCPHCGNEYAVHIIRRWHGDNCKLNPNKQ